MHYLEQRTDNDSAVKRLSAGNRPCVECSFIHVSVLRTYAVPTQPLLKAKLTASQPAEAAVTMLRLFVKAIYLP